LRVDPVHLVGLWPGVATELRAEFPGWETAVVEVRASHAGEVLSRTIDVRRAPGAFDLELVLRGEPVPDGTEFLLLDVRPVSAGDPGAALLPEGEPRTGISRGGRVVFEGVVATGRSMRLVPGSEAGLRNGTLADAVFELAQDRVDLRTVEVRLERGAELRVRALTSAGAPTGARARVLDSDGQHVATLFVVRGPAGPRTTSTFGLDANNEGDGWNAVVPNLPPGDYVLQVELEGQARRDVPLRLVPGELNEATVQF
jgi:hypothetical protein